MVASKMYCNNSPSYVDGTFKTCYLMGDFNLNLLKNENHNVTGEFLDGLYSHLFFSFNHVAFQNYFSHC